MRTNEQKLKHTDYMHKYYRLNPWKKFFNKMNQRCNNPKCDSYKYYGGKGIRVRITENEIKKLWLRDKAYELTQPSLDRKDNTKDYTFENCQFIEMELNIGKDRCIKINQFDKDGNFIKTWDSIVSAEKELSVYKVINNCLRGKTKTSAGYIWRYYER